MFNKNKARLVCKQCTKILVNPIHLPCICTICHSHLVEASFKKDSIKCEACGTEFNAEDVTPKENVLAKLLLVANEHLSSEEKAMKTNMHDLINQYEELFGQFRSELSNVEMASFQKFSEIRRKIDLQRETIKSKVDQVALDLIDQANKAEKSYTEHWKRLKLADEMRDFKQERTVLDEEFRNVNLAVQRVQELKVKHERQVKEIQANIADLNQLNEQIDECGFEANESALKCVELGSLWVESQMNTSVFGDFQFKRKVNANSSKLHGFKVYENQKRSRF